MTARIPYLSALTQRPSASPALRPPRRPFAEQTRSFAEQTLPAEAKWTHPSAPPAERRPAIAEQPEIGRADPASAPVATQPHSGGSVRNAPVVAVPTPTVAQDQPPISPRPADHGRREREPAGQDRPAAAVVTPPADLAPAPDEGSLRASRPEMSSFPVLSRPPDSWTDPRWGQPVELPQPLGQKESADQVPFPQASPAPRQAPRAQPRPVPDLIPPPSAATSGVEVSGLDTGPGRRRPPVGRPAQVSIGAIEVTVVPPAEPAAPQSTPPERRDRPRPVSAPPAFSGADRLRDGLRRWHGIAQG